MVEADSIIASFGESDEALQRLPLTLAYRVVPSRDDGVWFTSPNRYRLERWTSEGKLDRIVERSVDWFRPWNLAEESGLATARLTFVYESAVDRLVVGLQVRPGDWVPPGVRREGRVDYGRLPQWVSIVEIVNPINGELLLSFEFDKYLAGFIAPDMAYSRAFGPEGDHVIKVWRLLYHGL